MQDNQEQQEYPRRRSRSFLSNLLPRRGYIVTPVIFYLNLLMFVFISIYDQNFWFPKGETILKFGGDTPSLTLDGQWWRLFSSCFLHFGIIHFAVNMLALIQLGSILEKFIGSLRLVVAYVFCGIAGNVASNWWMSDSYMSVSAGASGAIFGLLGLFLALITTEFVQKEARMQLLKSIGITIAINVIISLNSSINSAAHFGGLFAGLISGYLIYLLYKLKLEKREIHFTVIQTLMTAALIFYCVRFIPKTAVYIADVIEDLSKREEKLKAQVNSSFSQKAFLPEEKLSTFTAEWNDLISDTDTLHAISESKDIPVLVTEIKKQLTLERDIMLYQQEAAKGNPAAAQKVKKLQKELMRVGEREE